MRILTARQRGRERGGIPTRPATSSTAAASNAIGLIREGTASSARASWTKHSLPSTRRRPHRRQADRRHRRRDLAGIGRDVRAEELHGEVEVPPSAVQGGGRLNLGAAAPFPYLINNPMVGIEEGRRVADRGLKPRKDATVSTRGFRQRWRSGRLKVGVIGRPSRSHYDYDSSVRDTEEEFDSGRSPPEKHAIKLRRLERGPKIRCAEVRHRRVRGGMTCGGARDAASRAGFRSASR